VTVAAASGRLGCPTPCTDWDAAGVVDHVIGFHQVLLLSPLGLQVAASDNPIVGWENAHNLIVDALDDARLGDGPLEIPARGTLGPSRLDLTQLLPILTTDVLIHTWDLARAVHADDHLDDELCELAYERVQAHEKRLRTSGMFGARVLVSDSASTQAKLLGTLRARPELATEIRTRPARQLARAGAHGTAWFTYSLLIGRFVPCEQAEERPRCLRRCSAAA
jgi:uncharacterized protein (TIGR03086 family)